MPICNSSSAWGLINNQAVIIAGSILLLLIILYLGYNAKSRLNRFGYTLIVVGGANNLYERIVNGCVSDYIKLVDWWPAFNVADGLIFVGLIIILTKILRLIAQGDSLRMTTL